VASSIDDIASGARTFLRDFPQFFEIDSGPINTMTVRLPHPLVAANTVVVNLATGTPPVTVVTTAYQLDERNGLLKFTQSADLGKRAIIQGYHFNWFLDSDLAFHANQVWGEMTYYDDLTLRGLQPAQAEVIMLGTVVHALWSLAMELSLDIDVSTPEGMFIPARQRFSQVLQMMQYWENEYNEKAGLMNMGLGALAQFRLRRVAYLTGRYVPVYKDREIDDRRPPERLYPPIPAGVANSEEPDNIIETVVGHTVEEIGREGQDLGYGGWTSIGTRG